MYLRLNNGENELTLASVVKEIATRWRSSSPKINKRASERASERASRKDNMTKILLSDLVKKVNKENTPPEGWTEEAKEGARIAASIGHELSDFSDSGDDLEELADIMNLDSPRYDNLKKKG